MTTYNSYEAAKIANPECEIYKLVESGLFDFCTNIKSESVRFTEHGSDGIKCNPDDHCMTVEKFLTDGHRLEIDDWVIGVHGLTFQISSNEIDEWNVKSVTPMDSKLYILRAAALEEKSSEKVEWANGDECVFTDKNGDEKTCKVIGLYPQFVESYVLHCENTNPTFFISNAGRMVKPETKKQREDRERLENGKSLHTAASKTEEAIAHGIFRLWEMEDKETRNHYCQLAEIIGHKTNYRKEVK